MTLNMSKDELSEAISIMARQPEVRHAVLDSFSDNPWWPKSIKDWRIRMIVAGLSTRVSFRMLGTYEKVIRHLKKYTFEELQEMNNKDVIDIIRPLGLANNRIKFLRSISEFIIRHGESILNISSDQAIQLIDNEVTGASYKVGACCILYAKGYNSGIIPVDSGLKDMFAPCLGLPASSGKFGHELIRYQLEEIASQVTLAEIAVKSNDYSDLDLSTTGASKWWFHLVLINYKRHHCNNRQPSSCPLKKSEIMGHTIGKMCDHSAPELGGSAIMILEGCDGVGKTTLADTFIFYGYKKTHFLYDQTASSIVEKYIKIFFKIEPLIARKRFILDRSFMSEHVYGPVLRGISRLSDEEFIFLCRKFSNLGGVINYLRADPKVILQRIQKRAIDDTMLEESTVRELYDRYEYVISLATKHCEVQTIDTDQLSIVDVVKTVLYPRGMAVQSCNQENHRYGL